MSAVIVKVAPPSVKVLPKFPTLATLIKK